MDAKTEPARARRHPYHEESEFHRAHQHQSASAVLRAVIDEAKGETISIGEIIEAFGERAFGFVLILFSLPNCVPAPPGIAPVVHSEPPAAVPAPPDERPTPHDPEPPALWALRREFLALEQGLPPSRPARELCPAAPPLRAFLGASDVNLH